jgi:hypothetical protein
LFFKQVCMTTRIVLTIASVLLATSLSAQQAPPPPQPAPGAPAGGPAQQAPVAPPMLTFASGAGVVFFTVKAEAAAEFESYFAKLKEALAQTDQPQYKGLADGWKLFRTDLTLAGQVLYASVIDPAVPTADYDPVKLLRDLQPAEAAARYPKLKEAIVSVNRMNLQEVLRMGQ